MPLRFQRITSGSSWVPQIDGLRFIAIFSVLLVHAYGEVIHPNLAFFIPSTGALWFEHLFQRGGRGVGLFFVISGYILSRPFLRQYLRQGHKVSIGDYLLRRVTRLEPPYILSLLLYLTALCVVMHANFAMEIRHSLASMFYVHNIVYPDDYAPNFVTWTLEIEIQFYLLAPLLGQLFRIRNTVLRRAVLVCLIALGMWLGTYPSYHLHRSIVCYPHYFLAGFLLADLLEFPRHAPKMNYAWDLISLIGWPAYFYLGDASDYAWWNVLLLIPLFLAAFHGKASNWVLRQPVIALTGGMCYSIYLLHNLVYQGTNRVIRHLSFTSMTATLLARMALLIGCAVLVSAVYYLLVERPCMDPQWPRKLWQRLRPADGEPALEPTKP